MIEAIQIGANGWRVAVVGSFEAFRQFQGEVELT